MNRSDAGRLGAEKRWRNSTPAQRKAGTAAALEARLANQAARRQDILDAALAAVARENLTAWWALAEKERPDLLDAPERRLRWARRQNVLWLRGDRA